MSLGQPWRALGCVLASALLFLVPQQSSAGPVTLSGVLNLSASGEAHSNNGTSESYALAQSFVAVSGIVSGEANGTYTPPADCPRVPFDFACFDWNPVKALSRASQDTTITSDGFSIDGTASAETYWHIGDGTSAAARAASQVVMMFVLDEPMYYDLDMRMTGSAGGAYSTLSPPSFSFAGPNFALGLVDVTIPFSSPNNWSYSSTGLWAAGAYGLTYGFNAIATPLDPFGEFQTRTFNFDVQLKPVSDTGMSAMMLAFALGMVALRHWFVAN